MRVCCLASSDTSGNDKFLPRIGDSGSESVLNFMRKIALLRFICLLLILITTLLSVASHPTYAPRLSGYITPYTLVE